MAASALKKPRIILGCMTFGPDVNHGARVTNISDCTAILSHFSGAGYTELDTARIYQHGAQEAFTAAAGYASLGLRIATKQYPTPPYSHTRESLRFGLTKSLAALGADCVDIFYLHAPDRSTPWEETLAACDELHREGRFRALGLSNFAAFEVAEVAVLARERGWVRPTVYQAMYNCVTRVMEKELLPACRRYGLDVVVYNPIAGGLFSGALKAPEVIPESGRFSDRNPNGAGYRKRYFNAAYFDALKTVSAAAEKHGLSLLEVAMRWLVHHSMLNMKDGGNDGVVIGVSSLEQLKADLEALEKGPLPGEVIEAVDQAWKGVKREDSAVDYWHGKLEWGYEWGKEKL